MQKTSNSKILYLLSIFVLLGGLLMQGCSNKSDHTEMTDNTLNGKTFILYSMDKKEFTGNKAPTLVFGEELQISGSFCNRFAGQATLENGLLSAKNLASTKMLCMDPYLNDLEKLVPAMLEQGASLNFKDERLRLTQGGHVVVYLLQK